MCVCIYIYIYSDIYNITLSTNMFSYVYTSVHSYSLFVLLKHILHIPKPYLELTAAPGQLFYVLTLLAVKKINSENV